MYRTKNVASPVILFVLCINIVFSCTRNNNFDDVKGTVKSVADAVLADASFNFIDEKSGNKYTETAGIPDTVMIKPKSV